MPELPSWPADEAAEETGEAAEETGVARLASAALSAPVPSPEAEQASQERVLTQFQENALLPRPLHEAPPGPAAPSLARRVGRVLGRLLGR